MSTEDLLKEISTKLDKILKLLSVDVIKDYSTEKEKIELLDSLGFRPIEIAKLLNKSPENVSVQLGNLRKKKNEGFKNQGDTEILMLENNQFSNLDYGT